MWVCAAFLQPLRLCNIKKKSKTIYPLYISMFHSISLSLFPFCTQMQVETLTKTIAVSEAAFSQIAEEKRRALSKLKRRTHKTYVCSSVHGSCSSYGLKLLLLYIYVIVFTHSRVCVCVCERMCVLKFLSFEPIRFTLSTTRIPLKV